MSPIHEFALYRGFLKILYTPRFGIREVVARSQISKIKNPSFWLILNKFQSFVR